MKILILHGGYGCETGCCGHYFEVDGVDQGFEFDHPFGTDKSQWREWAEDLVRSKFGEEHVKDLDWENSVVLDD